MGRKIICDSCGAVMPFEKIKDAKVCPVCNVPFDDNSDHEKSPDNKNSEQDGWITWYYYGFKNSSSRTLEEHPIDLEKYGNTFYLIKEFQAPPSDENGNCNAAKKELRKYVPDAFSESKSVPKVQCPYCYSTEIQMVPKKFSLLTGFLTNGYNRVCIRCKRKF